MTSRYPIKKVKKQDCDVKVQKPQSTQLTILRKREGQEEGQQSKMAQLLRNSPLNSKSVDWIVEVGILALVGLLIRPHKMKYHAQTRESKLSEIKEMF